MQALRVVPAIHYFDTFKDFNDEFKLGKGDILVTNQWMYDPYVKPLGDRHACYLSGKVRCRRTYR